MEARPATHVRGAWGKYIIDLSADFAAEWKPEWSPVHLFVDFNTTGSTFEKESCVVIPSTCRQEGIHRRRSGSSVVDFFFTVGFEVLVGGELKYRSTTQLVDCHNLLAHNLGVAARGLIEAHREGIRRAENVVYGPHPPVDPPSHLPKITGTHFGTKWVESLDGARQRTFLYSYARGKRTITTVGVRQQISLVPLQFTSCMQEARYGGDPILGSLRHTHQGEDPRGAL